MRRRLDSAVARPTVQGYFEVLTDTLLGAWLPAWRPRAKVKEVAHPKFYLFDCGVARALAGQLHEPVDGLARGFLLETWILHELRATIAYEGLGGELRYWRTPAVLRSERGAEAVGIPADEAFLGLLHLGHAKQEAAPPDRDSPDRYVAFLD